MGFRLKRYGPVRTMVVAGRLPGMGVPAARKVRTAERKGATATSVRKTPTGAPREGGTKCHRPQGVDREAECDRAKVDERRTHEPEVGDIGLRSSPTVAPQGITPYLPLSPSANSQAGITGRVSGWVWSPGGAPTSTYMRPERSSMETSSVRGSETTSSGSERSNMSLTKPSPERSTAPSRLGQSTRVLPRSKITALTMRAV